MEGSEERWRSLRRRRLVDAAAKIFAARGFEATSMDDIAREAGAGKPTLYRYFTSKDALFEAVFVDALDVLEARLEAAEATGSSPAETLRAMLHAVAAMFREHVVTLRALSDSASNADQSRRRILRQRRGLIEARIATVLERAHTAGILRTADARLGARLMFGMVWSGTVSAEYDDETVVRTMVDLFIEGDASSRSAKPLFPKQTSALANSALGVRGGSR